jgi:hypothetical protein
MASEPDPRAKPFPIDPTSHPDPPGPETRMIQGLHTTPDPNPRRKPGPKAFLRAPIRRSMDLETRHVKLQGLRVAHGPELTPAMDSASKSLAARVGYDL